MNEIIVEAMSGLSLDELANEANSLAEDAAAHMVRGAKSAWKAGQCLLAAKARVPHGQWTHWVRVNFSYELRTASRYMQIAREFPTLQSLEGVLSVRHAMRLIAQDSQPEEAPVDEPEPELVEEIETEPEPTPEIEPQERPSIRKVSAESRKVSEADRGPTPEVRPVAAVELVEEAEKAVVLYLHVDGDAYVVADADEVAAAALQLHEPLALVRMAVLAVEPSQAAAAIVELEQAIQWLAGQIEEAEA